MSQLEIGIEPPGPSGPGKAGIGVKVKTNHFALVVDDFPALIYRYKFRMSKKSPQSKSRSGEIPASIRRRVLELLLPALAQRGFPAVFTDFERKWHRCLMFLALRAT
jgi:hypothetical protein